MDVTERKEAVGRRLRRVLVRFRRWREMDSNFRSPVSGETLGLEARTERGRRLRRGRPDPAAGANASDDAVPTQARDSSGVETEPIGKHLGGVLAEQWRRLDGCWTPSKRTSELRYVCAAGAATPARAYTVEKQGTSPTSPHGRRLRSCGLRRLRFAQDGRQYGHLWFTNVASVGRRAIESLLELLWLLGNAKRRHSRCLEHLWNEFQRRSLRVSAIRWRVGTGRFPPSPTFGARFDY